VEEVAGKLALEEEMEEEEEEAPSDKRKKATVVDDATEEWGNEIRSKLRLPPLPLPPWWLSLSPLPPLHPDKYRAMMEGVP
jgi:hypothetical protein